jgi:hypothetical protein
LADESFLPAILKSVRRCPARSGYVELCFATDEGWWNWCFSESAQRQKRPARPLALTAGHYGPRAHLIDGHGLGPALPSSEALPMILDGAEVYVARWLVARGL